METDISFTHSEGVKTELGVPSEEGMVGGVEIPKGPMEERPPCRPKTFKFRLRSPERYKGGCAAIEGADGAPPSS